MYRPQNMPLQSQPPMPQMNPMQMGNPMQQNLMMYPPANRMGMVPKPELPLHLQVLFAPRMPLVYVKPPKKNKCRSLDPILNPNFDIIDKFEDEEPPEKIFVESKIEKKKKLVKKKIEEHKNELKEAMSTWNPAEDPKATGDPMKTLFVARLSYKTTEKKLRKEFEAYGPVKKIRMIKNIINDKPRGYAFVEFEHKKDFINAYKQSDGKKIDERRVLVDCERGRSVKGWKPRRFGGGKGETRRARSAQKEKSVNDKNKSRSRSRSKDKKRRSRSEGRIKSRSRERERIRDRDRERDRERDRDRDRDQKRDKEKDRKTPKFDKDRRKDKEKDRKEKDRSNKRPDKRDESEDAGILSETKKKKKKKGKDKDRSREKRKSKSPKDKKSKKNKEKKYEKGVDYEEYQKKSRDYQTKMEEEKE